MAETLENDTQVLNWILILTAFASILCICLLFYRSRKKRKTKQLYELEKEFQELKSYDAYAWIFMRNARAFQALIGIEREYPDQAGFMRRIQTEFASLLVTKDLTADGFSVQVPAVSLNQQEFFRRKASIEPKRLNEEIHVLQEGIREWENRRVFKAILEQTGVLLYRIIREAAECTDTAMHERSAERQADDIRRCIQEIYRIFCSAGIYPMFYEDFPENAVEKREFEKGSPYATGYPGFYKKQGDRFYLLQECWGIRRGEKT